MKKECSAGYDCDACKPEMSLRDWFAGMAMMKLIENPNYSEKLIATSAYAYADAMMKEREK